MKPVSGRDDLLAGWRCRLLGVLPVVFFIIHALNLARLGMPGIAWWICHVDSLVLGAGLLLAWSPLVGVALLWLILAQPFWIFEATTQGDTSWTSLLPHLGSLAVGLGVLPWIHLSRQLWWWALAYFVALQQLSRFLSDPGLNVNFAHTVRPEVARWLPAYWIFWLTLVAAAGLGLYLVQLALGVLQDRWCRRTEAEKEETDIR